MMYPTCSNSAHAAALLVVVTLCLWSAPNHHHAANAQAPEVKYSAAVYTSDDGASFTIAMPPAGQTTPVATANFTTSAYDRGYDTLRIVVDPVFLAAHPARAHYALGLLEGFITQPRIYAAHTNIVDHEFPIVSATWFTKYIANTLEYMKGYQGGNASRVYYQIEGLADGYQRRIDQDRMPYEYLSLQDIASLALYHDLEDVYRNLRPSYMTQPLTRRYRTSFGLAAIQLTNLTGDVLLGHNSFGPGWHLLRMLKVYVLDQTVSFFAEPAMLADGNGALMFRKDLIVMSARLSWFGSLKADLTPNSLPSSVRLFDATLHAANGADWAARFLTANSGTANAQYAVLDLTRLVISNQTAVAANSTAGPQLATVQPGFLTVVEQYPGTLSQTADMTQQLQEQGFWFLQGLPVFTTSDGYAASGVPPFAANSTLWFHPTLNRRAAILRKVVAGANTVGDFGYRMASPAIVGDALSSFTAANATNEFSAMLAVAPRADTNFLKPADYGPLVAPYVVGDNLTMTLDSKSLSLRSFLTQGPYARVATRPGPPDPTRNGVFLRWTHSGLWRYLRIEVPEIVQWYSDSLRVWQIDGNPANVTDVPSSTLPPSVTSNSVVIVAVVATVSVVIVVGLLAADHVVGSKTLSGWMSSPSSAVGGRGGDGGGSAFDQEMLVPSPHAGKSAAAIPVPAAASTPPRPVASSYGTL